MLDKKKLKNKILMGHLASLWTLIPFLVGTTLIMAVVTFSRRMGITLFAGVSCILGSAGAFFTQFLWGGEKIQKKVLEDLQKEEQQNKERTLNALDQQLCADGDPRTEGYLRDLRAICKALLEKGEWLEGINAGAVFDIVSTVDQLFRECIHSLERTLEILRLANQVGTEKMRKTLLEERERIITEVGKTIDQLGRILQDLKTRAREDAVDSNLAQLRRELDQSLEIAKTVDEKMSEWETSLGLKSIDLGREKKEYQG